MNNQDKVIHTNRFRKPLNPVNPDVIDMPRQQRDNDVGGDNNMNDKFVTHTELELSNEKLLRSMDKHFNQIDNQFNQLEKKIDANKADTDLKFEQVNTKFEKQKVWFYGTAIGIVTATCTIVGLLIKFI